MNSSKFIHSEIRPAALFPFNFFSAARKRASIQFGFLSLVIWLIAAVTPLSAQITGGLIQGIVTDPTGGVIANAQVTVTDVATGVSSSTQSNDTGLYVFPLLIPGTYNVTATASGFATYSHPGVALLIQQNLRVDITMPIGSVNQTVEVSGTPGLLDTETAGTSSLISGNLIANLPLFGRNPLLANRLVAGGSPSFTQNLFSRSVDSFAPSDIVINGTPPQSQEFFLDGVSTVYGSGASGFLPPTFAVSDIRVQTFALAAEYGQTGGSVTTIETKSGQNKVHGSLWYYHHDQGLDANSYFNNLLGKQKSSSYDNEFGGTVGGPVIIPGLYHGKDRTFFFFDVEYTRNITNDTILETVPTALERQGNFSQTFAANGQLIQIFNPYSLHTDPVSGQMVRSQFGSNTIPGPMINPIATNLLNAVIPLPNEPGTVNNYFFDQNWPYISNSYHFRIDHHLGAKDWLFGSYGFIEDNEAYPAYLPTGVSGYTNLHKDFIVALGYIHTFSSTQTLDVRAGVHRDHQNLPPHSANNYIDALGLPESLTSIAAARVFPLFTATGISGTVGFNTSGTSFITPDYRASLTQILGRHTLKFGYEGRTYRSFAFSLANESGSFSFTPLWTRGPSPNVSSATAGVDVADFLLGTPTSGLIATNATNASQSIYNAVYAQDNWRITSRLTLNLGLRWDMQTPTTERFNRANRGFNFTAASPIAAQVNANLANNPVPGVPSLNVVGGLQFAGAGGEPRQAYNQISTNFMPRVGAAFQLDANTVLRAGYGLFYPQFTTYTATTVSQAQLPLTQLGFSASTSMNVSAPSGLPQDTLANPFPNGQIKPVGSSLGLSTLLGQSISLDDVNDQRPRIQQYQMAFEHQLSSNLMFSLAYAGSRADKMPVSQNVDPIPKSYATNAALSPGGIFPQVANPFKGIITVGTLSNPTVSLPQLLQPYPQFTGVTITNRPFGSTWYNGLQATVIERASHGLSFLANYSWSKTMTKNTYLDPYDPLRSDISAIDRPNIFVVGGLWELPVGSGRRFNALPRPALYALGGWNLSWITTFMDGFPSGPWSGAITTRQPGQVKQTRQQWFDTKAFAPLPPYTLPSLLPYQSRVRQPGSRNIDLTIAKVFPIRERLNFEVGMNLYNSLNTPIFGAPNINVISAAFGTITSQANSPRTLNFHGVLSF